MPGPGTQAAASLTTALKGLSDIPSDGDDDEEDEEEKKNGAVGSSQTGTSDDGDNFGEVRFPFTQVSLQMTLPVKTTYVRTPFTETEVSRADYSIAWG